MPDPWPDRIIDLRPDEKLRLSDADPDRYWAQLRAEHREEAGEYVRDEIARRTALRRSQGPVRRIWRRLLRKAAKA